MGCFVAPVTTAIAAGCASGCLEKFRAPLRRLAICEGAVGALSAVEHVWHGEVTASWPFLTALATTESRAVLARELATEGVLLAVIGLSLWAVWTGALKYAKKRQSSVRAA